MRIDPLVASYPLRIRAVFVGVVLFFAMSFYASPRIGDGLRSIDKYIPTNVQAVVVPPTQQMQMEKPPARPSVPIASEDEFLDEDITIEETDLDDFEDWNDLPPAAGTGPQVKFIPYDDPPVPLAAIRPVYPEIAMEAGIEGQVVIQAFIDKKGHVTKVEILKGIPNTGLNEAALEAVKRSRWKPARQRDQKVGVWMSIPINFKLTTN